jgi:hypothetical protein
MLKVAISILQVGMPLLTFNEQFNDRLWISYHKHEYGLGEHYNSLEDVE